jgi:2-C-methyl-D-erythritol 2,4-cyclodiphosphate synthase
MRIGIGYDIHRMVEGRRLFLGGVEIDFPRGLLGHSDADVLIHAICDSLLGAAGLGDIGRHFPDDDERYRGISSIKLLKEVAGKMRASGFVVGNIDATLILQLPKLAPIIPRMEESLAAVLEIEREQINIKATTNEGLAATGREEAIAAWAVALIDKD